MTRKEFIKRITLTLGRLASRYLGRKNLEIVNVEVNMDVNVDGNGNGKYQMLAD